MSVYTEDEAKTKWCPHARVASDGTGNRYSFDHDAATASPFAKCLGPACMAWRWDDPQYDHSPDNPVENRRGHCGLAGKP